MKKFLPLICLAVSSLGASAQATFGHFDQVELTLRAENSARINAPGEKSPELVLLMRVADSATVDRLRAAGAEIRQVEGPIVVLAVEPGKAEEIAATEGVISVRLNRELETMDYINPMGIDRSRTVLGLDKAHSGAKPLEQPYTGEGVIVGVIDRGLDAQHLSLLDKDGNPRVKRIFFTLGNNSLADLKTPAHIMNWKGDVGTDTHGTHVAAIAAGSAVTDENTGGPDLTGAAPGADIILAATQGGLTNDFMIRSARQIADAAKEEGKPCVINISLGNNGGPMDGTDEASTAISEIAASTGAVFCIASGNEGDANATLHATFTDTPVKTFIESSPYTGAIWPTSLAFYARAFGNFEIWSEDETPVTVRFDLVKISDPGTPLASVTVAQENPAYIANPSALSSTGVAAKFVNTTDETFCSTLTSSFIGGQARVEPSNNRYHVECRNQLQFSSDANDRAHAVMMTIEGTPGKQVFVYTSTVSGLFPLNFKSRGMEGFIDPNGDGTLNAMACAHNIITVGSYNSHRFSAQSMETGHDINQTSYFSSWAKLVDGRHLPHICAPGMNIVSAMSRYHVKNSSYDETIYPKYYSRTVNGETYHWTPMTGTSMATPYMTGVAAMWLSANPGLTTEEIIDIAQETSSIPELAADNKGASGHLNAFAGLCKALGLSSVGNINADTADALAIIPSEGACHVFAPGAASIKVSIHNMTGITVKSVTAEGDEAIIATDDLATGIYLVTASTPNGSRTIKINL